MSPSSRPSSWTPKLTVFFSLFENFVFLSASSGDLVFFKDPLNAISSAEHSTKLLVAAFALIGVPIVFAGFLGILNRDEKLVRPYFYYMLACLAVNAAYVAEMLFEYVPCSGLNSAEGRARGSHEGPCGPVRGLEISGLALLAGIHLCIIHPTQSFCEELRSEASSAEIGDVAVAEKLEERKQAFKRLRHGPLSTIQGRLVGEYGSVFEAVVGMSWMGSGAQSTQLGHQPPHLPNMRLV